MDKSILIPMFPLTLLPLPGELVPLHIFEPRYRQLIQEAEDKDISFGIYFSSGLNTAKVGSLMKLESVIKRYSSGESDIVTKCIDVFTMHTLHRTFKTKMYPGGDATLWKLEQMHLPDETLINLFSEYMLLRNITQHTSLCTLYQMANELSLDIQERYKFLTGNDSRKEAILFNKLRLLIHLLQQEMKSKDVFHLN